MSKSDRAKLEKQFVDAEGKENIIEAFIGLLPTEEECIDEASKKSPPKFISKLHDIKSSSQVITDSVLEYSGAKLMRMRWEKRRLSKARLKLMDRNLLSIYNSANDTLEVRPLPPEKEEKRGRDLLDICKTRTTTVNVDGFTIDHTVAKGELQCLANGEGFGSGRLYGNGTDKRIGCGIH